MQKSIVWEGLANDTEEHCSVNYLDSGITIRSEIEGWAENKAVYVEYVLHLDKGWRAMQIEMDFHVSDHQHSYHLKRDEHNNWTDNAGKEYPDLHGCDFVDISLTPFTNSLPVNALHLQEGDSAEFDLVYFDIIANEVRRDRQKYTKMPGKVYLFENDGSNFSAEITVNDDGFVTDYPQLFEMLKPR